MNTLFGKALFKFKKPAGTMYDFAQHGLLNFSDSFTLATDSVAMMATQDEIIKTTNSAPKKPIITPQNLFKAEGLNDKQFMFNTTLPYIEKQIEIAKQKLDLLGKKPKEKKNEPVFYGEPGSVKYGREELESIIERLENRKKVLTFRKVFDKYPYTTSKLVNEVVNAHSNLRCDKADSFVPDFPEDAVAAMKEYNETCLALCNKKAVFYVIADHKDFQKIPAKRDPILLAQSPFGFFWQVLGAWDDEMIYLGDL